MKQETFTTLFEYLGRPAKLDISGQVYKAAKNNNIEMRKRSIVSNTYTGLVTEYPKSFLDSFFGKTTNEETTANIYVEIHNQLQEINKKIDNILNALYNYDTTPIHERHQSDDLPF